MLPSLSPYLSSIRVTCFPVAFAAYHTLPSFLEQARDRSSLLTPVVTRFADEVAHDQKGTREGIQHPARVVYLSNTKR